MQSGTYSIAAQDGRAFEAYASVPDTPNGDAVIVLQEIFGVTDTIRAVADKYAQAGYLAVAPDLFWRMEPGLELSHSKADIEQAMLYLQRFDEGQGIDDIGRTAAHIRSLPGFKGRIATVGLCLGGKLAFLSAARLDMDAAVSFYGVGIETALDEAAALRCPLMLHYGDKDHYAPNEAVARIEAALRHDRRAVMHRYPGAGHGFYTRGAADMIALAHERTLGFLAQASKDAHP